MTTITALLPVILANLSVEHKTFVDNYGCFLPSSSQTCPNCKTYGLSRPAAFYFYQEGASIYLCDSCHTDLLHIGNVYLAFLNPTTTKALVTNSVAATLIDLKTLLSEEKWYNENAPKVCEKERLEWNMTPAFRKMTKTVADINCVVREYYDIFFNYEQAVKQHSRCDAMQIQLEKKFNIVNDFFTKNSDILCVHSDFKTSPFKQHICD